VNILHQNIQLGHYLQIQCHLTHSSYWYFDCSQRLQTLLSKTRKWWKIWLVESTDVPSKATPREWIWLWGHLGNKTKKWISCIKMYALLYTYKISTLGDIPPTEVLIEDRGPIKHPFLTKEESKSEKSMSECISHYLQSRCHWTRSSYWDLDQRQRPMKTYCSKMSKWCKIWLVESAVVPSKATHQEWIWFWIHLGNRSSKQVNILKRIVCLGQLLTKFVPLETSQLPIGSLNRFMDLNNCEKSKRPLTSQSFMVEL
jgi:hypothetical protein